MGSGEAPRRVEKDLVLSPEGVLARWSLSWGWGLACPGRLLWQQGSLVVPEPRNPAPDQTGSRRGLALCLIKAVRGGKMSVTAAAPKWHDRAGGKALRGPNMGDRG